MTKKAVRQRKREQDPFYRPKPAEKPLHVGHGQHRLDQGRPGPQKWIDLPPCLEQAQALVDAALAWAGAGHAPMLVIADQEGREVEATEVFKEAHLSRREAEAWRLYCAGFSYLTIRDFMEVTRTGEKPDIRTVETYLYRGRVKLRLAAELVEARKRAEHAEGRHLKLVENCPICKALRAREALSA